MHDDEILINITPKLTRVAVVNNSILSEVYIEKNFAQSLVGNIYVGKIVRILPSIQCAFVDIGKAKNAFLHIKDCYQAKHSKNIEKILQVGTYIVVQVLKDEISTKGARLTSNISISGKHIVYLPFDNMGKYKAIDNIGISKKIIDLDLRTNLQQNISKFIPDNIGGAFIVRTSAATELKHSTDELKLDMQNILYIWNNIQNIERNKIWLIYNELSLIFKLCRDVFNADNISRIYIDDKIQLNILQQFMQKYTPKLYVKLELCLSNAFDKYNVSEQLLSVFKKKINLKSGAQIIIEQTEAMTVIDVNSDAYTGESNIFGKISNADLILKINIESAVEIARQIKLRNLGGIIIIDFIDMQNKNHQDLIIKTMNIELKKDHEQTHVIGFTALGLLEMTRKRTKESLHNQLCTPCNTCSGTGFISIHM
jgi:ribonuclease G